MSQQANIVAFDGAATPVSHTLEPTRNGYDAATGEYIAEWSEKISSLPDEAQVKARTTFKRNKDGTVRVFGQVEVPIMESVSGQNAAGYTAAPKVAYVDKMQFSGNFNARSTVVGRRLARQLLINMMGNVTTSVAPVATGPVPELVDKLIQVS